ncbi:hypothetical protein D3C75_833300 [compost metagenome]
MKMRHLRRIFLSGNGRKAQGDSNGSYSLYLPKIILFKILTAVCAAIYLEKGTLRLILLK